MTQSTYLESGVDIAAGNEFVDSIKPLVKTTARIGSNTEIGGFGGFFDLAKTAYKDPILVSATDGVGTKLKIASEVGKHDTIGIDLVAMCVNDLIVHGAEPLFFLDYFSTGKLDISQAKDVVKGIVEGCKEAGCALVGGETAEMPGMYKTGDYDLAGFSVGAVERDNILPKNNIAEGDVIIGLPSSGVHSNGFSLVRHIIEKNSLTYNDIPAFSNKTLGEILLTPTKIYVKECLELIKKHDVKALAHITGGGLTENIPRILPDNLAAEITLSSWDMPDIFKWLAEKGGIPQNEMLTTFNCGIGMVLIVDKNNAEDIDGISIGKIVSGNGVLIVF